MSRVGAQYNETFRGWHEIYRRITSVKGSKASSSVDKVGNITPTS